MSTEERKRPKVRVRIEPKKRTFKKYERDFYPVYPVTFYSGPTTTVYTITDRDDPLVAYRHKIREEKDATLSYNEGDLVFVFYDKEGSCRPGRITNKKMAMVREKSKGEVIKVERVKYTVDAIEHTVAMGKDTEGQLWTMLHVTGTGKQHGSKPREHLATSLAPLKQSVKYYIVKKNV